MRTIVLGFFIALFFVISVKIYNCYNETLAILINTLIIGCIVWYERIWGVSIGWKASKIDLSRKLQKKTG